MSTFPPQPKLTDITSVQWIDWLNRVRNKLGVTGILFSDLDFTGSNITSIVNRDHNDLTSKQGGTANEFYHLTQVQHTDLTDGGDSALHFHSSDRARANHTGTQDHNSTLSGKQGGTTNEFYHLTSAEYSELQRQDNVSSISTNTSLDDTYDTILVTTTAKIITLPAASSARIGKSWTIILGTTGYVDISRTGSDTINLPTNSTTIRLRTKGASVTLRCLTATSWGIV